MARQQIPVMARESTGKGSSRSLRRAGRVPAIVYGYGLEPIKLQVEELSLDKASRFGANEVFDLTGLSASADRPVLIRELQRDPVSRALLHCDFYAVNVSETVDVQVPVHYEGTPVGVKDQGGVFERVIREIEIRCLPLSIPDNVSVDVEALEIGDAVHVSDLVAPEGSEILSELEVTLAHVVAPRVEEEPVEGAEDEAALEDVAAAGDAPAEGEGGSDGEDGSN